MHSTRSARWALPLALATALAVISTTSAVGAEPPGSANSGPPLVLDHARRGEDAITALGARLSEVAARNDLTGADLAALLRADQTAWLDASGRLFFVEPVAGAVESPISGGAAPFPYDQTFQLHSFRGSDRVIYLDFDGHQVTGTGWNVDYGEPFKVEPYTIDTDGLTFSPVEREEIQQIWQRVAEDFAPFEIDVTTEAPPDGALTRADVDDSVYGTRVVITDTNTVYSSCTCGGVAYVGTFDAIDADYYDPAFVFTRGVGHGDKAVAEAASHEAAHNLGLLHDGTRSQGYYEGQGSWAPIMGVGYYEPITQWSRGEYNNANNKEDDFVVMQSHGAMPRSDDHGGTLADAIGIAPGASLDLDGLISTQADVDVFKLNVENNGQLSVAASPAPLGPNLDIRLELLDSTGQVTASADPVSGTAVVAGENVATGLGASLSIPVTQGTYYLRVDGVGAGSARSTGYSDYASVGAYKLSGALVAAPASVLHVSSIGMSTATVSRRTTATATVSVVDALRVPQAGATVTVSWSGSVTGTTTGVTLPDGSVALVSPSTSAKRATFTVTVTSIERAGSVYDPSVNVETTDTIST